MTNKEAIKYLIAPVATSTKPSAEYLKQKAAYDLAIKTLEEQRPKGEWRRHDEWINGTYIGGFYHFNCPCEDGYYSKWETNFCPNCGAAMRKEGKEE